MTKAPSSFDKRVEKVNLQLKKLCFAREAPKRFLFSNGQIDNDPKYYFSMSGKTYTFAEILKNRMLKFISFGSGSSGNCYLLQSDKCTLMIDSGVGVRSIKKYSRDYGIKLNTIDAILVTHDHADHVKSVGAISNENKIPVYATEAVHKGIFRNYCVRKKIDADNVRKISVNVPLEINGCKITAFEVPHDSCGNVGYRIEAEDITFCLMTDIGHITEDIKENISLADYLVIEANHDESMLAHGPYPQHLKERVAGDFGHLSNTTCAKAIKEYASKKLKHVWLCHLSEENNHPELLRKTLEATLSEGRFTMGNDFKVEILKRKSPSDIFELT